MGSVKERATSIAGRLRGGGCFLSDMVLRFVPGYQRSVERERELEQLCMAVKQLEIIDWDEEKVSMIRDRMGSSDFYTMLYALKNTKESGYMGREEIVQLQKIGLPMADILLGCRQVQIDDKILLKPFGPDSVRLVAEEVERRHS